MPQFGPLFYGGPWLPSGSYAAYTLVNYVSQTNTANTGTWVCLSAPNVGVSPDTPVNPWVQLSPSNVSVLTANNASGDVTFESTDNSILISNTPGQDGSINLSAVSDRTAIVVNNQVNGPALGYVKFTSLDGSVSVVSAGGRGTAQAPTNVDLSIVTSGLVQSVLNPGFALQNPASPLNSPSNQMTILIPTNGSGYYQYAGNWLASPPPLGVQNIQLLPLNSYHVTGTLQISYGISGAGTIALGLNCFGAPLPLANQSILMPGTNNIYFLTTTGPATASGVFINVSAIFTVPSNAITTGGTVPAGFVPLRLDAFLTGSTGFLDFQWNDSFSCTRL
jgi:hypothetical protein